MYIVCEHILHTLILQKPNLFTALLIALFTSNYTYAQENIASWYCPDDYTVEGIYVNSGFHVLFGAEQTDTVSRYTFDFQDIEPASLPQSNSFSIHGQRYFTFPGSSVVLRADSAKNKLERIDLDRYDGYNKDAYQFLRKDTIFSFGGNGFWNKNALLTYFSFEHQEWTLYSRGPLKMVELDKNGNMWQMSFWDKASDYIYTTDGKDWWQYSFAQDRWSTAGVNEFMFQYSRGGHYSLRLTDSSFSYVVGTDIFEVIPHNNRVYRLEGAHRVAVNEDVTPLLQQYSTKDTIVFPRKKAGATLAYTLRKIAIDRLGRKPESTLYITPTRQATSYTGILILAVMLVYGFLVFFKFNKRSPLPDFFTKEELSLVNKLQLGEIDTEGLNNVLGIEQESWETQRKRRSEFIRTLNEKAMGVIGKDIVLRVKNPKDKRQVLYSIDEETFNQLYDHIA